VGDVILLPITAFSPGVGHMGAHGVDHPQVQADQTAPMLRRCLIANTCHTFRERGLPVVPTCASLGKPIAAEQRTSMPWHGLANPSPPQCRPARQAYGAASIVGDVRGAVNAGGAVGLACRQRCSTCSVALGRRRGAPTRDALTRSLRGAHMGGSGCPPQRIWGGRLPSLVPWVSM
jgi:hypothetical protein